MSTEKHSVVLKPNEVVIKELLPIDQDMYTLCGGDEYVIILRIRDVNPTVYTVEFCREDEESNLKPFAIGEGSIDLKTHYVPDAVSATVLPKRLEIATNCIVNLTEAFDLTEV